MPGLKHHASARRKLKHATRRAQLHLPPPLPGLFFLTDPSRVPCPAEIVECLPARSGVIYRHFGKPDRVSEAFALAKLCRKRGLIFLIANDPHLAKKVAADGVHWPETEIAAARYWRCSFRLQTCSAHSRRGIVRAEKLGIRAGLVSTVFTSNSPSAGKPLGALKFRKFAKTTSMPLFALGGVTANNAALVADYGGLAAIEGVSIFYGD